MSIDELIDLVRNGKEEIQADWMPATGIRALVRGDPSLIWLDQFGEANGFRSEKSPYDFLAFIGGKGRQFEEKWISELASTAVLVCAQDYEVRSIGKVFETIGHLHAGVPAIAKPALWWGQERVYGVPDLVVHTSWLEEKFPKCMTSFEKNTVAVNLFTKPGHYVAFDIKFTTGLDGSDKKVDYANYSAQGRIYSYMLGQLQGAMPRNAYMVTRDRLLDPLAVKITSTLGQPIDADLAALRDHFVRIKLQGSKLRPWTDNVVASNLSNQDEKWGTAKDIIARERVPGRDPALLHQVSPSIKQELKGLGFPSLDSLLGLDPAKIPFEKCKGLGPKRSKVMRAILQANGTGNRSGKLEGFIEVLVEILENDEKALVFSQFTQMLSILRRVLDDKKVPYFYLDGSTPVKERGRLKDAFQRGEAPFFLISLQAGGLGMTLTEANCVVHYDRWWNPAVEDQATDRTHRIGQHKPVKVFRIHTLGTIDERIGELQNKKKDLFNAVIEVDQMRKEITKEELLALFEAPIESRHRDGY